MRKGISLLALACAFLLCGREAVRAESASWTVAESPRGWNFPRDHGAHPEFRTEWWYFTGNLHGAAGERYGYELTFFRQGLAYEPSVPGNRWAVRDAYLAHFALTDGAAGDFRFAEKASRGGPGLARAARERLDVRVLSWSARHEGERIVLEARTSEMELELTLRPRKRPVLHGSQGLSRKGPERGQASYYASITDLETRGFLRSRPDGPRVLVSGKSWFDHEFGSNQLGPAQEGWDWFGLHLSDGREVMLYFLRRRGGDLERASSGTIIAEDGSARHLSLEEVRVDVLSHWTSPKTGATYPSRWRISIPSAGLEVFLTPIVADQELTTGSSTGVVYWEGAVAGEGLSRGRAVRCEGYVELTGYAHGMGGRF